MKKIIIVAILLAFMPLQTFSLTVSSIKCGLGIKNRQITKEKEEFKVGDKVYCLSDVTNISDNDTYIINRWVSDEIKYDVKLEIKPYTRFRTWSYKTVYHPGVWKMEVLDKKGNLIKEKIFVVK